MKTPSTWMHPDHPKRSLTGVLLTTALAALLLGATGPSCPGTQAIQMQLDLAQKRNQELGSEIQLLRSQIKELQAEVGEIRTLAMQVGNTVLERKRSRDSNELEGVLRSTRAAPARAKKGKSQLKKTRKRT